MTPQMPLFVAPSPVPGYQERIAWQKAVQNYIIERLQTNPDAVMNPTVLVQDVLRLFGATAVDILRDQLLSVEGAMEGPVRDWFEHHHAGKLHAALTVDPGLATTE